MYAPLLLARTAASTRAHAHAPSPCMHTPRHPIAKWNKSLGKLTIHNVAGEDERPHKRVHSLTDGAHGEEKLRACMAKVGVEAGAGEVLPRALRACARA